MLRGAPDTYAEQARRRMRLRSRGQGAAPARDAEGVQSEEGTRVATPPGAADGGRERERNGVMPIEWHADVVREEGGSRGGVNRRQLLEDSVTFVPTLAPTPMVGISVPTIPTTPAPTMLPTVLATVLPTIASTMAPSLEPTQPVAEETASDMPQVRCDVVQCGAVQCGAVRCGAVRRGVVLCDAARARESPRLSQPRYTAYWTNH